MADNKDLYLEMDNIIQAEQNNGSVGDERKEAVLKRLQELADQGNDFDPDRLDGIIALASGNTSDVAQSVLQKAKEQKSILNSSNDGMSSEIAQDSDVSFVDKDVEILSQPSYNVRKEYERLSAKEGALTEEEKDTKRNIERDVETYLSSVNNVNTDNVVAIMDYLAVSEIFGSDEVKERNESLSQKANEVIAEYDKENGLDALEGQDSHFISDNLKQWKNVVSEMSQEDLTPSSPYSDILNSLSDEERRKMQEFMMINAVHSLKVHSPSEFGSDASKKLSETLGNTSSEYALLINEEYLKQEAMADFCEQNKITAEQMNEILAKEERGETLSAKEQKLRSDYLTQLQTHLEKAPSFMGPYKNKEILHSAITTANAMTVSRLRDLDCRMAQKVNAPSASKEVTGENNTFAKKHPKLALAINFAKGIGTSMAIGAIFGPVGLTAYSAWKTVDAIRKSYNRFEESSSKTGFKNYLSHLISREGRGEALALAGSVAATCISGYFTLVPGLENIQNIDLGIVGNFTGNTGVVADVTQTATQTVAESVASVTETTTPTIMGSIKDGFSSIMQSPRRAISMTSSFGIGITKGVAAWNNLRYARKQLAEIIAKSGGVTDKNMLRSLEGLGKDDFYQRLQQIAPNLNEAEKAEAFKHVTLANNSNPKSEFLSATIGAGIGLGLAAATDYIQDSSSYLDAQNDASVNTESPIVDAPNVDTSEVLQDSQNIGDLVWQNDGAAEQRFESFGIDAKGANEMLREMGIIKEGDNHFYRQSELNNLVNNADLTPEEKGLIQVWADDRNARVDAMLKWQEEHPTYKAPELEIPEPAPLFNEPIPAVEDTLPEKLTGTMYNVQGKIDGQNFQMNVLADNPVEAGLIASEMADENGFLDKKSSIEVRGDGVVTEIEQKAKDDYVRTKITTRDLEGDKIATQTIKTYDNGTMESKFKGDLDGDGKNDTITRVTGADGTSVSHEKFGNGERAVSYTNANGETTEVTSQEMEENGVKRVNSQLKKAYKEIAEGIRENSANEQTNAGLGVSTSDNAIEQVNADLGVNSAQMEGNSEQAHTDFNNFSEQAHTDFNNFSEQAHTDFNNFSEQAHTDFNNFSEQAHTDFNNFSEQARADFNNFSEQARADFNNFSEQARADFNNFSEQAHASLGDNSAPVVENTTHTVGNEVSNDDPRIAQMDCREGNILDIEIQKELLGVSDNFKAIFEGDKSIKHESFEFRGWQTDRYYVGDKCYEISQDVGDTASNRLCISINDSDGTDSEHWRFEADGSQQRYVKEKLVEEGKGIFSSNDIIEKIKTSAEQDDGMQRVTSEIYDISYKFDDNGSFTIDGTMSSNDHSYLLPKTTCFVNESGSMVYKCGESTSLGNPQIARLKEMNALGDLCIHQEVYNDLQSRASNGETLGMAEQNFMSQHEGALSKRGLVMNDGKIERSVENMSANTKINGFRIKGNER